MKWRKKTHLFLPQLVGALFLTGSALFLLLSHRGTPNSASLAYYVQAERLDPIFAIEGTDPAKLKSAVAAFLTQKNVLIAKYGDKQKTALEDSIYPAAFLTDLPGLEAARQTLLKNPTAVNAALYHTLLVRTITDYANDAKALAAGYKTITGKTLILGYTGGESSSDNYTDKLNTVAMTALQQRQKEDARFACFQNTSTSCTPLTQLSDGRDAKLAAPPVMPKPTADVYKADAMSQQFLPLFEDYQSFSKTIFAIPSDCYANPTAYERVFYLSPYEGGTARKLDYINDVFFQDIPRQEAAYHSAYTAALVQAGATVTYETVANQYECPDSGFDETSVGSLIGVREALAQKTAPTSEEQKLLALPVLQKADVAPYVQEQAALDTPEGNDIVERYIEGSSDFDQVLLASHSDNHFLQLWSSINTGITFDYILSARNYASTLFLLGNPTFMPEPISLFSVHETNPPDKELMREYTDDVSKHYTDAEILDQIKKAIKVQIQLGLRD